MDTAILWQSTVSRRLDLYNSMALCVCSVRYVY